MRFVALEVADPMKYPKAMRRAIARQQQDVWQAFRDHNERIRPLLPPSLQQLQEAYVHDAQIRLLRLDPRQRTLHLSLFCCDSPGCFDLNLYYKDITLNAQETSLLCLLAYVNAEIYTQEVDLEESADPPIFLHRILWQTRVVTDREATGEGSDGEALYVTYMLKPEIELRFGNFEIEITPNPEGEFSRAADFITIVRDPEEIVESLPIFLLRKPDALSISRNTASGRSHPGLR